MNKICTSLEQSKKLIELRINITTADMYYSFDYNIEEYDEDAQIIPKSELGQHFSLFPEDIPCWSLQALLDEIPDEIMNEQEEDLKLHIDKDDYSYGLFYENEYTGDMFEIETDYHDNFIDTCVEMIMKLHKLKLL